MEALQFELGEVEFRANTGRRSRDLRLQSPVLLRPVDQRLCCESQAVQCDRKQSPRTFQATGMASQFVWNSLRRGKRGGQGSAQGGLVRTQAGLLRSDLSRRKPLQRGIRRGLRKGHSSVVETLRRDGLPHRNRRGLRRLAQITDSAQTLGPWPHRDGLWRTHRWCLPVQGRTSGRSGATASGNRHASPRGA